MIRIVSDGPVRGTKVYDSQGNQITGIVAIEILPINLDGDLIQARITFTNVELDVVADDGLVESTEEVTNA